MRLSKEMMRESGSIDYVAMLGSVEAVKRLLCPDTNGSKYSVLLFDSVYFILDYPNAFRPHECPSRYKLLSKSDVVFRVVADQIEILKSRISMEPVREIFESRGIVVYRVCSPSTYDEE